MAAWRTFFDEGDGSSPNHFGRSYGTTRLTGRLRRCVGSVFFRRMLGSLWRL